MLDSYLSSLIVAAVSVILLIVALSTRTVSLMILSVLGLFGSIAYLSIIAIFEYMKKEAPFPAPELIWSRGLYGIADHVGDNSTSYVTNHTEKQSASLNGIKGKRGIIWLRLGSTKNSDIVIFARDIIHTLSGPTILITTDGDNSVPDHLNKQDVDAILKCDNIVAWYTQNLSNLEYSPKFHAYPIGLDLHSVGGKSVTDMIEMYTHIRNSHHVSWVERPGFVWSDCHLTPSKSGIRERWKRSMSKYHDMVDATTVKLSRDELWEKYCTYKYVVSLPGNGLDCHRTYEAAYYGAVVVTTHSSLDALFAKMNIAVVYVSDDFSDFKQQIESYEKQSASNSNDWLQNIPSSFHVNMWRDEMDLLLRNHVAGGLS